MSTTVISEPIKISDCGTDKVFTISRYHKDGQGQSWTFRVPSLPEGHDWEDEGPTLSIYFSARCKKCKQSTHLYRDGCNGGWRFEGGQVSCDEYRMKEALE